MKNFFLALACATLLLTGSVVQAAEQKISEQQAMNIATRSYPGRVLSVKLANNVYKVKTLSDSGKVRIIEVDASSGKILSGN